jgi:tRNA(Ile)-lysidine synthase
MGHAGPPADSPSRVPAAVRANLHRLGGTGRGVVAVSGGADSVALLRALADPPAAGDLVVAHLNHRLRGVDADADAAFVTALCPHLPHRTESVDVRALAAAAGDNLEDTARRARYDFLRRVAQEAGAVWVATAHTRDDQAETVLHRLIRGAGLRGLRGIAGGRDLGGEVRLLRPMLTVARTEVIAYLREIGQPWREDATNRDPAFTRNRIRHELLPLLRTFNPAIEEALARTAAHADEVYTGIEQAAGTLLTAAERPRAGPVIVLDRAGLADVSDHALRELLYLVWQREGWPRGGMTGEHWQRAADVVLGKAPAWDLPGGIRIVGRPRVVHVDPAGGLTG